MSDDRLSPNLVLLAGIGGLAWFAWSSWKKGGGLGGALGGLLGSEPGSVLQGDEPGGSLPLPPDPGTGLPLDAIEGAIVSPPDGGSVQRPAFGSVVRFDVEVANGGASAWSGPLLLDVAEDYLFFDERGSAVFNVTVPARSSRRFQIDYRLSATFLARNPNLSVSLFAGDKYLGTFRSSVV